MADGDILGNFLGFDVVEDSRLPRDEIHIGIRLEGGGPLDANAILFRLRRMRADALADRRGPVEYHITSADLQALEKYVARFTDPHISASYYQEAPEVTLFGIPIEIDDTRPSHLVVEGGVVIESAYDKPKAD